jgi:hypothetical protein
MLIENVQALRNIKTRMQQKHLTLHLLTHAVDFAMKAKIKIDKRNLFGLS